MADVNVRGLPELVRALRQVDGSLNRELVRRLKTVADHVVGVAQQRMPFGTGDAARSVKPRATQKGAGIAFPAGGPDSAPAKGAQRRKHDKAAGYYPWLDFGGTTGKGHVARGHNGFGGSVKRTRVTGGRYIYPAIAESKDFIREGVDDAIKDAAHAAGFTTTGHV